MKFASRLSLKLCTANRLLALSLSSLLLGSGTAFGASEAGTSFSVPPGAPNGAALLNQAKPLPPVEGQPANLPAEVSGGWKDVYTTSIAPENDPTRIQIPPGMEGHPKKGVDPVQHIPILELPQTPETIEKVTKKEAEGEKFFRQHLLNQALASWQECYGLSIEMKYSEGEGVALTNMCRVYLERGQFTKAKYMGENATEVLADLPNKNLLGRARVELARAYFGLGNAPWAGAQLEAALTLFSGQNATTREAAEAMSFAGGILMRLKKFQQGLQFYEAAATYYEQSNLPTDACMVRISTASFMDEFGLYVAAHDEAQKALSLARTSNDKPTLVAALSAEGMAQYSLCEYANARKSYEEALQIVSKLPLTEVSAVARANIDVGYGCTLAATGDLEQSATVLSRAIPAVKSAGDMAEQAQIYNVLGTSQVVQGQYAAAIPLLEQSLDVQGLVKPKQHKLQIITLQNLAAALSRSGDNRDARQRLEMALPIFKTFHCQLLEARTYTGLAEVCLKLLDSAKAEDAIKDGISIGEKINDDASLWRDYTILAKIQMTKGQEAEAKASLQSALSHFRSPQASSFPTPERMDFPSSREDMGEQLAALCAKAGLGEQALLTAEELKEESFSNEWQRRNGQVRADDRDAYLELVTLRSHLHAAEAADNPQMLVKDWQSWLGRFSALVRQNKPLARMIAPVPNSIQDITKIAHDNHSTLLEYLVGAESSVAFTVEQTGRIAATVLPVTRKQLTSQVTALYSAASCRDDAKMRVQLQAMYGELLPTSVRNFLPKNPEQVVAVIPDGILYNLPFAALMDQSGHYLIEQHTLTLASSASVFMDSPPKYAEQFGIVIASAPATQEEASMLSSVLGQDQVTRLVGKDAVTLQAQARGKASVHLASSLPMTSNPLSSIVPLAPDQEDAGKVTANRLMGLSWPNDLFVLSGTAINANDTQGTAVKVLSRGLNYAGARNVLMSLWLVPDQQRVNELSEFYKNKQSGLTQAQSLRKAQMLVLSRDPSPRSWAAFQLLGPGF